MIYPGRARSRALSRIIQHPDGRWEWTGACTKAGVPIMRVEQRVRTVSAILWESTNGPLPEGARLKYSGTYNSRADVNPAHYEVAMPFFGPNQSLPRLEPDSADTDEAITELADMFENTDASTLEEYIREFYPSLFDDFTADEVFKAVRLSRRPSEFAVTDTPDFVKSLAKMLGY